ncbi:MAG: hypothetical protein IE891_03085 [Flavobacteriaceae bacterium]|nr:hypothetical protein [Flavobacteriaceae bacterium]
MKTKLLLHSLIVLFSLSVMANENSLNSDSKKINMLIMQENDICANKGTVIITESSTAYTSYKNLKKQLDLAQKNYDLGAMEIAQNNLKNAIKYAEFVLKKEPNANLSELCALIEKINGKVTTATNNKQDFAQQYFQLQALLQNFEAYTIGMLEVPNAKKQKQQIEEMVNFNREETLNNIKKLGNAIQTDFNAQQLQSSLINIDQLLKANNIINRLYNMLDELDKFSAVDLSERSQRALTVIKVFNAIGGNNTELKNVMDYANKQLNKANNELASVYTSNFHKENMNKIVFTKVPFKPGTEDSVEINPVFKTGDAVYATIYMKGKISEVLDNYGVGLLYVTDENEVSLQKWFEKWEVENYTNNSVKVIPSFSKENTYYQFVLIPNLETTLKADLDNKNITPIHMARGMTKQPSRKKTFSVLVSTSGSKFGTTEMKGEFQFDFSQGNPDDYYSKVDNKFIEQLIQNVELPSAAKRDATLESQLLANMNSQGWEEKFTRVIIVESDWTYYKPISGQEYREIEAAFPYSLPDGKCGYYIFSFKSFKNGTGGWTAPQKFGGSDKSERIACNKI